MVLPRIVSPGFGVALSVALCGGLSAAAANDWDLNMSISEQILYDDNLFLRANAVDEVFGATTQARVGYTRSTPKSETGLQANIVAAQFWGDLEKSRGDLDSVDPSLSFSHKRRGRTSLMSFGAGFRRQQTRESELEDSGRLGDKARRDTLTAAASFARQITRRDQIGVNASYREVSYSIDTLTGYRSYDLAAVWSREISPTTTTQLSIGGQRSESDDRRGEQDDVLFATLSVTSNPIETLSASAYFGARQIFGNDIDTVIVGASDDDHIGFIFGGSLDYKASPKLNLSVSADRQIAPSSTGLTQETLNLAAKASYALTPILRAELNTLYFRREDLFGPLSRKREYVDVSPGLVWEVGRNWDLFASYRYRSQSDPVTTDWADSNSVVMGAKWRYQGK